MLYFLNMHLWLYIYPDSVFEFLCYIILQYNTDMIYGKRIDIQSDMHYIALDIYYTAYYDYLCVLCEIYYCISFWNSEMRPLKIN